MGHLNAQKIGLDTDEEIEEEVKPKGRKGQLSKEPLKAKISEKLNYVSVLSPVFDDPDYKRHEAKSYLFENIDLV